MRRAWQPMRALLTRVRDCIAYRIAYSSLTSMALRYIAYIIYHYHISLTHMLVNAAHVSDTDSDVTDLPVSIAYYIFTLRYISIIIYCS